jgi:GT2 family glycosyltransferase
MATTRPSVAIVVLNWNGWRDTLPCLESLAGLRYSNTWVIVVDNGSTDESAEVIGREHPQATLLTNGENLGYADGNNVGIKWALNGGANYVMLLNNDTIIAPDAVDLLVEAVEADPEVGVAGPTVYYHEDPERIWSAGGVVNWQRGSTHMVGLDQVDQGQFGGAPRRVDFVTGCAMLVDRATLERAGLLDGRFFMYYEEAEWCLRASKAGAGIVHVPRAKVWHKISAQRQAASPRVHYYMSRNRLLFLRRSGAGASAWAHVAFEYARTLASWSLQPRWRHKRAQRDVMLRAIADFFRGRFGRAELATG